MLKRIATAVVLIPIVMLLVLRAPVPVLAVFAAAVALVTVQEFLKADRILWRAAAAPAHIYLRGSFISAAGGECDRRDAAALRVEIRPWAGICLLRWLRSFF